MTERTWRFPRPAEWPAGPWDDEPDKVQWVDEATGLDCLIHRGPAGALCGYVGVPPGHRFHGRSDLGMPRRFRQVHGGLTFAGPCQPSGSIEGHGICHVPEPGRPDDVWWLGFDCCHAFDLAPRHLAQDDWMRANGHDWAAVAGAKGTYRDQAYVRAQCERLARLLAGGAP